MRGGLRHQGLDSIRTIQRADKEEVHSLCFSPFRALMVAVYDDDQYWLLAETPGTNGLRTCRERTAPDTRAECVQCADENGEEYRVPSSVTQTEDVSYVSSAYVPACLRQVRGCVWRTLRHVHT